MTIGSKKNLATLAKHMAFINSITWFAADRNSCDFLKLRLSNAINTRLSENEKLEKILNIQEFYCIAA